MSTPEPSPKPEAGGAGNRIDRFLQILPKRSGSDLHLSVGSPPIIRIDGELERMRYRALSDGDFYNLVGPITPPAIWKTFQETGDVDFAYQMGEQARFRVNLLQQERGSAAVFRIIPSRVPTAEDLNLPVPVAALYAVQRGMILVTGPTGSGKSTSLAAILDRMNKRLAHHVITIEDPIEFIHTNDKSIFTQREIGPDVPSFAEGVKAAIREDPDALLVGEMRDLETMRMALTAAETGLLVFADRAHELGGQGRRPDHRRLPRPGAGAGADRALRGPARRRGAAAPAQEGRRAGSGLRDPAGLHRALQRDPRGEDVQHRQPDPDRQVEGDDLDGSVAVGAGPHRGRRGRRGPRARHRQGRVQDLSGGGRRRSRDPL